MCGASQSQQNLASSQAAFYTQLTQQYQTEFAQNQSIMSSLTATLQPIIAAGPSQQGYSDTELAALNARATESAAAGYRNAATALGEKDGAAGGGNIPIGSAAQAEVQGELATAATGQLTNEKTNILSSGFQQGNRNYEAAVGALSGVPGAIESPLTGAAGAAVGAGSSAMTGATDVNNANNSWEGLLGGLASSALSGGLLNSGGGGGGGGNGVDAGMSANEVGA
jgi:hypothetical protein